MLCQRLTAKLKLSFVPLFTGSSLWLRCAERMFCMWTRHDTSAHVAVSQTPPPFIICTSRQDSPVCRQLATSSDEMKSVLFHSHTCTRTDPRLPFAAGVNTNMSCLFAPGADAHNLPALFVLALPKHSCLRSQFMRPDQGLNWSRDSCYTFHWCVHDKSCLFAAAAPASDCVLLTAQSRK